MLMIRRKLGECFEIGTGVFVQVAEIHDGHVLLAVDAPKSVPVVRAELTGTEDEARIRERAKAEAKKEGEASRKRFPDVPF